MLSDLKFTLRLFLRNPGFTLIAVLTLALGIGGNTSIFSVLNCVLLRPMPAFAEPENLAIAMREGPQVRGDDTIGFSYAFYEHYRQEAKQVRGVVATTLKATAHAFVVKESAGETPETIEVHHVSGNFFSELGIKPAAGRLLVSSDDTVDNPRPVVVLSHDFWETRFNRDPAVIGQTVLIETVPFTVIGVGPKDFNGAYVGTRASVWVPLEMARQIDPDGLGQRMLSPLARSWLNLILRLKPGISQAKAEAEIAVLYRNDQTDLVKILGSTWPEPVRRTFSSDRVRLVAGGSGFTRFEMFKPVTTILVAVTILVLMVSCANVASLLLARGTARTREFALRLSLGASRYRLIRQLLTESIALAFFSGVLGIILAHWGVRGLTSYLPSFFANVDLSMDAKVLAFIVAISLVTGLGVGLVPAFHFSRLDLNSVLKSQSGGATGARQRLAPLLIVMQIAVTVCLLANAGLFVRTLQKLQEVDIGFNRSNLLFAWVSLDKRLSEASRPSVVRRIVDEVAVIPGVVGVSVGTGGLVAGGNLLMTNIAVEGHEPAADDLMSVQVTHAGHRMFEVVGLPVVRGRSFLEQDMAPGGPRGAVIVNEALVRKYFPDRDPIGKRLWTNQTGATTLEIVGVARDTKYLNLREPISPQIYVPFDINSAPSAVLQIRMARDLPGIAEQVSSAIQRADPSTRILAVRSIDQVLDRTMIQENAIAEIAAFFSILALSLACIGLYGSLAYSVSQRTREIGVRMALGASLWSVVVMIVRQGLILSAIGCAGGVAAAIGTAQMVASRLYGISAIDPLAFFGTVTLLVLVSIAASLIPAYRAAKVDPLTALRTE